MDTVTLTIDGRPLTVEKGNLEIKVLEKDLTITVPKGNIASKAPLGTHSRPKEVVVVTAETLGFPLLLREDLHDHHRHRNRANPRPSSRSTIGNRGPTTSSS